MVITAGIHNARIVLWNTIATVIENMELAHRQGYSFDYQQFSEKKSKTNKDISYLVNAGFQYSGRPEKNHELLQSIWGRLTAKIPYGYVTF